MKSKRELGIVIYGATGYTGRLVVEYFNRQYGVDGDISWAMAGRSLDKLISVRDELGVDESVPLVVADAADQQSLEAMVQRAAIILTTVGPYQLYGSELVAACASFGTDYVDLCGEPVWMHQMINQHTQAAMESGARIIFSCGFDSIPFDMGVFFLQQTAISRMAKTASRVKGRVRQMKGSFSGGTQASFTATMAAAGRDPAVIEVLKDPFALSNNHPGPEQPRGNQPFFDDALQSWVAPFVMASINTKNIHRSNFLLGHQYGANFVYDEMFVTGPGDAGEKLARAMATGNALGDKVLQPGEGPSKEERDNGGFDILMIGEADDGGEVRISVTGDCDPGYGSTSKMVAESAICLLRNADIVEGGIWTPAPAMGSLLIRRLRDFAGLTFVDETLDS
tara:strand:+ start:2508 stop:3692 length:1185 start_codon:yes stop_codon:yes gene_type:complete